MNNTEKVLNYLRSISPKRATNADIVSATSIKPHQQVFQITHKLCETGTIKGIQLGREWVFWVMHKAHATPYDRKSDAGSRSSVEPSDDKSTMDDISNKILTFHAQLESDEYHRYKSWEHCYNYFNGNGIDVDMACLHMSFYLASWGMYRGSSFLLWKDYLIHKKVVEHILNNKHLQKIDYQSFNSGHLGEIFSLIGWIKDWYKNNIKRINGIPRKVNVTDTLATKIILGTLGCVPAYDRYFIDGLRAKGLRYAGLTPDNFLAVVRFYQKNKQSFGYVNTKILDNSGVNYPPMKLVDMYFWELGFEADNKVSNEARSTNDNKRRN